MLGRDFEDEVRSRSVFELASNPIGYFGKMNSTLGSVVPLAMFSLISLDTRSLLGNGFIGGRFAFAASREGHLPRRELWNNIFSTKT